MTGPESCSRERTTHEALSVIVPVVSLSVVLCLVLFLGCLRPYDITLTT